MLKKTIVTSLAFILGFSLIFVLLGATATAIGQFLLSKVALISKIAGVIVIILGLHFLGLFEKSLQFLNYEKRFHVRQIRPGIVGSFVIGLAFAFGWTPCVGPILGPILFLAGGQETVWQGIFLLSVYSLGLGVPFLLTAIATHSFINLFNKVKQHFKMLEIISGVFLIIIGVLMVMGKLSILAGKLLEWFPGLAGLEGTFVTQLSGIAAFIAGLLSFFSPCVLPLVPAYISFMSGVSVEELRNRAST